MQCERLAYLQVPAREAGHAERAEIPRSQATRPFEDEAPEQSAHQEWIAGNANDAAEAAERLDRRSFHGAEPVVDLSQRDALGTSDSVAEYGPLAPPHAFEDGILP